MNKINCSDKNKAYLSCEVKRYDLFLLCMVYEMSVGNEDTGRDTSCSSGGAKTYLLDSGDHR